jgi:hypothetical protein
MSDKSVVFIQEQPRGPSELVEIPVSTAGVYRVNIPDIQQLRSQVGQIIIIKAIRLVTVDVLTNGVITGFVNAPATEIKKIVLVIYSNGWEKGHYIPLQVLNDTHLSASIFSYRDYKTDFDDWQNVDWSKSYLLYANGTGGSVLAGAVPYVVMIEVEYVKLDSQGQTIDTAS